MCRRAGVGQVVAKQQACPTASCLPPVSTPLPLPPSACSQPFGLLFVLFMLFLKQNTRKERCLPLGGEVEAARWEGGQLPQAGRG